MIHLDILILQFSLGFLFYNQCLDLLLTSLVEFVAVPCWFGVWIMEDRLADRFNITIVWQSALFSLVNISWMLTFKLVLNALF